MNLWVLSILFFLGVSILLYVLLGGADFGAGILELKLGHRYREEQRKIISHAMAPVWEANHVWLILVVVILFMGFPSVYTLISTYLYFPLLAVLLGVIGRGCAFTFRHYDSLGEKYYLTYSSIFSISSIWTSFFLGVAAGAVMLGKISLTSFDFKTAYIYPWFNLFCASVGVFTCALFAFLASVYLVGEAKTEELRLVFLKKAKIGNLLVILTGGLVFVCAENDGLPLLKTFLENRVSLWCFIIATLFWIPFWFSLKSMKKRFLIRALAVCIVALVLLGWFAIRFPVAIQVWDTEGPRQITFEQSAAPEATLIALLSALIIGALLIFPALGYLLKIFKWS